MDNTKDSFLVDLWERIFFYLGKLSIFELVRKNVKITYRFVDYWVVGNCLLAIISSIFVFYTDYKYLSLIIATYGFLRIFETIVYQINVVLFDPYRAKKNGKPYRVKSIRRMIIALFHNYIEIIFWYSTITSAISIYANIPLNVNWIDYTISTILCVVFYNDSGIYNIFSTELPVIFRVVFFEIISGLIMTIISIARFIGILPTVDEIDES